ncbi:MAG: hypothetical protein IID44_08520 [Planctomycetes bacterium]|nr:hypothetical protein [Planctomycetota bacterium]
MSDAVSLPTKHELKLLTFRAIVAYAVRASLRVERLYQSDNPAHEEAVKAANRIAFEFVGSEGAADDDATDDTTDVADAKPDDVESGNAYAADRAAYAAADAAARADVGSAAADAAARAAYAADRAADAAAFARFADAPRADAATTRAADAAAAAADAALRAAAAAANDNNADDDTRAEAIAACRRDYEKLLEVSRDLAGELGPPFDVKSENGPLGPLWSQGEPASFLNASKG